MLSQSLNPEFDSAYEVYTDKLPKSLEKVVCLRCSRPLTNEKSRQARLGSKCARKLAYETRTRSFSAKTLQHYHSLGRTSHGDTISTQDISLYYSVTSSTKPYCKIGTVSLPATDSYTTDGHNYRKKTYSLPLLNDVIYEIYVSLPHVRVFLLQVQNQHLKDITTCKY